MILIIYLWHFSRFPLPKSAQSAQFLFQFLLLDGEIRSNCLRLLFFFCVCVTKKKSMLISTSWCTGNSRISVIARFIVCWDCEVQEKNNNEKCNIHNKWTWFFSVSPRLPWNDHNNETIYVSLFTLFSALFNNSSILALYSDSGAFNSCSQ